MWQIVPALAQKQRLRKKILIVITSSTEAFTRRHVRSLGGPEAFTRRHVRSLGGPEALTRRHVFEDFKGQKPKGRTASGGL